MHMHNGVHLVKPPDHDDLQPCDLISNVDTSTSGASLTPSDILCKQIKLEKTKLDLGLAVAMRKAKLEAREKMPALSNRVSCVSQASKQLVCHSVTPEQMRPLTQPLDNIIYAHIAQSPQGQHYPNQYASTTFTTGLLVI